VEGEALLDADDRVEDTSPSKAGGVDDGSRARSIMAESLHMALHTKGE
jgi:hypothetical protein